MYPRIASMTFKVIDEQHGIGKDARPHRTNRLNKNYQFITGNCIFINSYKEVEGIQRILIHAKTLTHTRFIFCIPSN